MAPASCSTDIAQPRSVRIAARRSFVISIENAPIGDESSRHAFVPAGSANQGFQIGAPVSFSRVLAVTPVAAAAVFQKNVQRFRALVSGNGPGVPAPFRSLCLFEIRFLSSRERVIAMSSALPY
jgi:hypothetical protein